jgi:hypothetical protein
MATLQKNVASQNVTFVLVNATTGAGLTGATVSITVTKDNGTQAAGGGTVTEKGSGQYNYAPTQAETNAVDVGFLFTATNAVPVNIDFHTDITSSAGFVGMDLQSVLGVAVNTNSAQLGVNVVNWAAQAVSVDANNLPKMDVEALNGSTLGAQALGQSTRTICWGTVGSGSTPTSINVSALNNPSSLNAIGQLNGRTLIFLGATTTTSLQSSACSITNTTTGVTPTLTVTGLAGTPASGDTFAIL